MEGVKADMGWATQSLATTGTWEQSQSRPSSWGREPQLPSCSTVTGPTPGLPSSVQLPSLHTPPPTVHCPPGKKKETVTPQGRES